MFSLKLGSFRPLRKLQCSRTRSNLSATGRTADSALCAQRLDPQCPESHLKMDQNINAGSCCRPIHSEMSSVALAISGGALALVSLFLKRASERDSELLQEMSVSPLA